MNALPLQFLMLTVAGWVNRHQQGVIEYLQAENRALREQLGGKQLRFTDRQRRRLAVKAKAIGRRRLTRAAFGYVEPYPSACVPRRRSRVVRTGISFEVSDLW